MSRRKGKPKVEGGVNEFYFGWSSRLGTSVGVRGGRLLVSVSRGGEGRQGTVREQRRGGGAVLFFFLMFSGK